MANIIGYNALFSLGSRHVLKDSFYLYGGYESTNQPIQVPSILKIFGSLIIVY